MCTLACLTGNRPETAEKMWSIIQWAKLVPPETDPRLLLLSSPMGHPHHSHHSHYHHHHHHHRDDLLLLLPQAEGVGGGGGGFATGDDVPWNVPRALSRVEAEHGYYPELIGNSNPNPNPKP